MSGFRVLVRAAAVVGLVGGGLGLTPNVVAQDRTSQTRDVGHPSAGPVAAKRVMTFTDLMAMKRVSDPQVSPSGRWVLFSVTDVSLEKNTKVNHLWVVSLDGAGVEATADSSAALRNDKRGGAGATGGAAERQITFGDGESFGRFSPDGKWVSMTVGDDVWLAPWDEAAGKVGEAKQLTRVSGGGADGAVWSPDSKRLMFVAQVWPECSVKNPSHDDGTVMNGAPGGDANATTTTEANTGVLHFVQDDGAKGVVAGGTRDVAGWRGAEAASWADEDACDKAKDAAVDGTPVKGQVWDGLFYRHWDHLTGAKRSHVLVVDVDGTGVRDLTPASAVGDAETPTFSLGGPLGYAWAPDGKEIAYVTNLDAVPAASTNNDVFTLRLDEVGARAVKISTSLGSDDGPEYSPDGKWLAFRSQKQAGFESDRFRLMLFDRGTKAIKDLMPRFNGWVDEFVWDASSESIYFVSGEKGNEPLMKVAVSGANAGKSEILLGDGEFSEIRTTLSPQVVVASYVRMDMPSTVATIETRDPGSDEKVKYPDVSYVTKLAYLSHANDAPLSSLDLSRYGGGGDSG
jgi:dipeptidyl aminopeptidase/acylaminoacyl peptidase